MIVTSFIVVRYLDLSYVWHNLTISCFELEKRWEGVGEGRGAISIFHQISHLLMEYPKVLDLFSRKAITIGKKIFWYSIQNKSLFQCCVWRQSTVPKTMHSMTALRTRYISRAKSIKVGALSLNPRVHVLELEPILLEWILDQCYLVLIYTLKKCL